MTKRRIHLTESQLYGLVEQTLNELDWKTYMNAAKQARDRANDASYMGSDFDSILMMIQWMISTRT